MPPPSDWLSWLWVNRDEIVRLLTLIGGAIGIYFLAIRTRAADRTARAALDQAKVAADQAKTAADRHEEQTKADRERRITESFAKAVEQLGSDKLETRLGAIYTLERISQESEREYWPIMETLTAYVREHAPWPPRQALANPLVELQGSSAGERAGESTSAEKPENATEQASIQVRPATDIQAILTVLGRRDEKARKQDEAEKRYLDLARTNLRCAFLVEAHLEGAWLRGAHLAGANLLGAHLERAFLVEAHLEGAKLLGAHLEGADLGAAHLEGADLGAAHLEGADLGAAHLESAILLGAVALTQKQLDSAYGDDHTVLPEGLTRPARWSKAPANAQPADPANAR